MTDNRKQTRILIAEGKAEARRAMSVYLDAQPGLDVVGEAADCQGLLEQAKALNPDLVLLEWDLSGRPKADLIAALRNLDHRPLTIVLGKQPEISSPAIDAGADAFVYMGLGPEQMLTTIHWLVLEAVHA